MGRSENGASSRGISAVMVAMEGRKCGLAVVAQPARRSSCGGSSEARGWPTTRFAQCAWKLKPHSHSASSTGRIHAVRARRQDGGTRRPPGRRPGRRPRGSLPADQRAEDLAVVLERDGRCTPAHAARLSDRSNSNVAVIRHAFGPGLGQRQRGGIDGDDAAQGDRGGQRVRVAGAVGPFDEMPRFHAEAVGCLLSVDAAVHRSQAYTTSGLR